MTLFETVILAMGLAWASGINLYATLGLLGILGIGGQLDLPPDLEMIQHPGIIVIAVVLYVIEFVADKIPAVDSLWDGVHTFIRIPAGAMIASGMLGDVSIEAQVMAFMGGGGLAALSHTVKAGSRAVINTSPEPFTNIIASITEDIFVIGGLFIAIFNPTAFAVFLAIFLIIAIWIIPKILRGIRKVFHFLTGKKVENTLTHATTESSKDSFQLGDQVLVKDLRKIEKS
ncbi:DUF4126 domain-containing protein [Kiloniella antarctica]|uniref:DUF4126 domain-containing protein n=1 Tax=Kiloniella antarctica TaxID=1550907 RepID=A0ABW5BNX8_9PROT